MNQVDESNPKNQTLLTQKNRDYLIILALVMFIGVFLYFFNVSITLLFDIKSTTMITLSIYFLLLCLSIFKVIKHRGITIKNLIIYLFILTIFGVNYLLFETSRTYLIRENMLLIYTFYLPISIFIVSEIEDWDNFLKLFSRFARCAIILSTIGILLLDFRSQIGYMGFSYSLLPFILISYYGFRQSKEKKDLMFFLIGTIDIIIFGARAPGLFIFLFVLIYEFIIFRSRKFQFKTKKLIPYILVSLILLLSSNQIVSLLKNIATKTNSRFLIRMLNGEILESSARLTLYSNANKVLGDMGFQIHGLFADRVLVNEMYVHNIFYEILLSFGFIIGIAIIVILLFLIIKTTLLGKNLTLNIISLIFTVAFFLRYIISGSFVIEGNFYLYIAILINLFRQTYKEKYIVK